MVTRIETIEHGKLVPIVFIVTLTLCYFWVAFIVVIFGGTFFESKWMPELGVYKVFSAQLVLVIMYMAVQLFINATYTVICKIGWPGYASIVPIILNIAMLCMQNKYLGLAQEPSQFIKNLKKAIERLLMETAENGGADISEKTYFASLRCNDVESCYQAALKEAKTITKVSQISSIILMGCGMLIGITMVADCLTRIKEKFYPKDSPDRQLNSSISDQQTKNLSDDIPLPYFPRFSKVSFQGMGIRDV